MRLDLARICPVCGKPFRWRTNHRNRRAAEEFALYASTITRQCHRCYCKSLRTAQAFERGQRVKDELPWLDINDFSFEGTDQQKAWARDIVLDTLLDLPRLSEKGQDKMIEILGRMTASDVIDNRQRFASHLLSLLKK